MGLFRSKSSKAIRVRVFAKTDPGKAREHNEDCFLVADLTRGITSLQPPVRDHILGECGTLFVVTDGMGGAAAGEIASEMAAESVFAHMNAVWRADRPRTGELFAYRLREGVEVANRAIHAHAVRHPELRGMGTTCTAAGLLNDYLYITQVGDSRAYLIRGERTFQLTKDQSLMQRLVDAGELTEEEAAQSERRNIILQALGPDARVKVDVTRQRIRSGDALVLCSDGLSGQATKEEIGEVVSRGTDLLTICTELISLANERGGPDNVTVIVADLGGEGLAEPRDNDTIGYQVYHLTESNHTTGSTEVEGDEGLDQRG